ncbi:IS240-type transposase [Halanaeroarchaeum sulfurireducens]|uniref:IS240-type transposase n=1 Tax=Halanaeroarchaeum sulfurireducens TaxID=1604004 RepID=A0A0F7PA34_9EURY|nr:IS240-type transposase [Halanaeroarchaeum sulfurireducens]ALG82395.1 IS240-type transposase [Halanaeroarchaeum sulfurireducens]
MAVGDLKKIALDETVVKVNGERYWLVAAVDPDTNSIFHFRLDPSRNTALTKMFL